MNKNGITLKGVRSFSIFLSLSVATLLALFLFTGTASAATSLPGFPEDFGTGSDSSDIPGWEKHEAGTIVKEPAVSGNDSASPDGGRFVKIAEDSGDTGSQDGYICMEVDASGYENLQISYYWRGDSDGEDSGAGKDEGIIEGRNNGSGDGTCGASGGWDELKTHVLFPEDGWSFEAAFYLPEDYEDSKFLLRFRNDSTGDDEYFRVDGIDITGDEIEIPIEIVSLKLVSASPINTDIATINDFDTFNLDDVGTNLSIVAVANPEEVGSVELDLDSGAQVKTENIVPYSLFGDSPAGNYSPIPTELLTLGLHSITATPYSESNLGGSTGTELTRQFYLIENENTEARCTDGIDNDGDEAADEEDADCSEFYEGEEPADSDGDGVDDEVDECPETPEGAEVDEFGCQIDSELGQIYGSKYDSANENGISGWLIYLYQDGDLIDVYETDEDGNYYFFELEDGDYLVCEENVEGWSQDSPDEGEECENGTIGYLITIEDGEIIEGIDFWNSYDEDEGPEPIEENTAELCGNGADDNLNDLTDLDDPTCSEFKPIVHFTKVLVADNVNGLAWAHTAADFILNLAKGDYMESVSAGGSVHLDEYGEFEASESGPAGYQQTFSGACEGGVVNTEAGGEYYCTITNDDLPQCSNGLDDDGDGRTDDSDAACSGPLDDDEGNDTGGGGGQSPTGGGEVLGAVSPEVLGAQTCSEYLTEYIFPGAENNPEEVKKLQEFLNEHLGLSLLITGVYDPATIAAVNQFQLQYWQIILLPWQAFGFDPQVPSGSVYKMTLYWINMLKCPGSEFPYPQLP